MTQKDPTLGFEGLIAALQICMKYSDTSNPTHCEHDIMYLCVDPELVSEEDKIELERLHFTPDSDDIGAFSSYAFGSA